MRISRYLTKMAGKSLSKRAQQALLADLYRLAKSGLKQRDVADQLVLFGNSKQQLIGEDIIIALNSGDTFAAGLKPWLTSMAWEALVANETTGQWAQGLAHAKQAVTTQSAATLELIKALVFPALGLVILVILAGINATKFLPMLSTLVPERLWGSFTKLSLHIGEFSSTWGANIGLGFFCILILATITLPWFSGRGRKLVENLPLYRQYRLIQVSTLLRSMSHLSQAGFGLQDTLTHLKRNTTPYLRGHITIMQRHIKQGENNLGRIMDTGILNKAEQHSMLILGDIGGTADTLANCADIHHELLMSEIGFIKSWGANFLKISAAVIGGIMAGGLGQLLILIPTALRF